MVHVYSVNCSFVKSNTCNLLCYFYDLYLLIRENEAAGQLQLIHQLEAGLRKQQQIIDAKDKVCSAVIHVL